MSTISSYYGKANFPCKNSENLQFRSLSSAGFVNCQPHQNQNKTNKKKTKNPEQNPNQTKKKNPKQPNLTDSLNKQEKIRKTRGLVNR